MKKRITTILVFVLGVFSGLQAQEKDDIGTETITVVKAYTPTVSDAFKINSAPNLNDSIVVRKKNIEYNIFSVPVASTFAPAKGKAATVEKLPPPKLFNSYVSVGLGNYNNALVDFYTSRSFNRGQDLLDIGFNHHSSRGEIEGTALDNVFYNSKLNASYAKKDRDYNWGVNGGFQHQIYNWYGIPEGAYSEAVISAIDEKQSYLTAELGAQITMEDYLLKKGEVLVRRFWDGLDSGENRAIVATTFELPVTEETITIKAMVDYVSGSFANASMNLSDNVAGIDYGHVQFGVSPSLLILRDDLTVNLGANIVYGMDTQNKEGNFYIYPAVTASYRLLEDKVIAYGGIEGELRQNTYHSFVGENPYVSPTLSIMPTDQQYDAYLGLKGQLFSNVSYNIKGSYKAENRKPLFKLNPENSFRTEEAYAYGNSFDVFYDDVKTLGIFGELNIDVNRNFSLGINAEVYDYDTETDNPAWNLPNLKGAVFLDYQIGEQWFMGANLFYVDSREDISAQVVQNVQASNFPFQLVTLDSYFDANAHVGYRFDEQLSVFMKASNIANNSYQRWSNYPVQGFQILAGVSYKFDF